jgi:hypothetical protein
MENQPEEVKKQFHPVIPVAIVGLIVIVVSGFVLTQNKTSGNKQEVIGANTAAVRTSPSSSSTDKVNSYKDGDYSAVGSYAVPNGATEQVGVKLHLKGDIIDSVDVQSMAKLPTSVRYQGIFIENYKQYVVGKPINAVELDEVSGSSLTPKGFNDALQKIKEEAKA